MKSIPALAILAVVVSTLLGACMSPGAPSARTISKIESRTLREDAVIYRVVGQLGDILHLIPPAYPSAQPVNPLQRMLFWTTPQATDTAGICSADLVSFQFAVARKKKPDAETPTRVSGISAETRFRHLPEAWGDPDTEQTPDQLDRLQAMCEQIDPYQSRFFVALNSDYASSAARLFARAQREATTSPEKYTFDCYPSDPECRKTFPELPLEVFVVVEHCGREGKYPNEIDCTKFESREIAVHVRTTGSRDSLQITKVDVEWRIYMDSILID